jgi:SAM-dependent methyltransferase
VLRDRFRTWRRERRLRSLLARAARRPRPAQELFGGVDDELWMTLLLLRQRDQPELRDVLPGFPDDALQIESTGAAGPVALGHAFPIYRLFKELFEEHGGPLSACGRVLDFGCGWGRILRFFLKDVEAGRIWGIDARDRMIDVCRRTMPGCHFERAGPWPPTTLEDGSVDFVYAFSVFSHLSEEMHLRWLEEFHRILKPGGIVIVSTRNRHFIEMCEGFRAQADLEPHLRHLPRLFPDAARSLAAFDAGEYCYDALEGNWWSGEACIPRGYVARRWSGLFTLLDYIDDPARCEQNVIVARRAATPGADRASGGPDSPR